MGDAHVRMIGRAWKWLRRALLGALVLGCLLSLSANADSSARRAEETLEGSLAMRFPGVSFEVGAATYDPGTHCYVIDFRADGFSDAFTAYVRGTGVTDNYEAVALYDDVQSAEFSAQCRLLAAGALEDGWVDYDEIMASVQVPRGKYGADMAYNPALVDEKVDFQVYYYGWSDDEAAFSKWCSEVYDALLIVGFPVGSLRCVACEPVQDGYGAPIYEMTM